MALTRKLTIADGQVAATATEITVGPSDAGGWINALFYNTGDSDETLILTLSRDGGTARTLRQITLAADEAFELVGLPLNGTDSLRAQTTTASTVDYVVAIAAADTKLASCVYDSDGLPKVLAEIIKQLILFVS